MPVNTEYVYLNGKVKWCRPQVPDPWGNWKTDLYPTAESLNKFKELKETKTIGKDLVQGLKNILKKDEDGEYFTVRRPQQKLIRGKVIGFAPPEILDGTKTNPDGSHPPLRDVIIGNGSDVTIKLAVYKHRTPGGGFARACRWESLRVDNLVPFTKEDRPDDVEKQLRGLEDQPKPTW